MDWFAKGALVDDRVIGIVVHVRIGGEADLDAQAAALAGHFAAEFVDQAVVLDGAQHELLGEGDGALLEAHAQAPFGIHGDQQRQTVAGCLVAVGEYGLLFGRTLKKTQPAGPEAADQAVHLLFIGRIAVGVRPQHEELTKSRAVGQAVEHGVHPLGLVPVNGVGVVEEVIGVDGKQHHAQQRDSPDTAPGGPTNE